MAGDSFHTFQDKALGVAKTPFLTYLPDFSKYSFSFFTFFP